MTALETMVRDYTHLTPANIDVARAIARRKRLLLAAALVLVINVGCACATGEQDTPCQAQGATQ